tara:strand:- start:5430 stop:5633 length:204 start_codon:yes stop_codon:yes gene_type:complete
MKIVTSSPYATFNVKEWHSITKYRENRNQGNFTKLQKKYSNHLLRHKSKNVLQLNSGSPKIIQLSFA